MELTLSSLLTAEEVAELLHLKPSTVYDAAARGRLPCVRLWSGGKRSVVRFVPEDIARVIRERGTGSSMAVGASSPTRPTA